MADLLDIREDLKDELGCHGAYLNVKQSRDDPRIVVELHEFVYEETDDVESVVEQTVAKHTDLDVDVTIA